MRNNLPDQTLRAALSIDLMQEIALIRTRLFLPPRQLRADQTFGEQAQRRAQLGRRLRLVADAEAGGEQHLGQQSSTRHAGEGQFALERS